METLKEVVILLVEDDIGDQKLVKKSFEREKIANKLHIAGGGEDAWAYLQRSKNGDGQTPKPDLILLDLNMPGIGGKELLRRIKADAELSAIPVVILTTSDSDQDILNSFKLQASGYIQKPVTLQGFYEAIHNLEEYWFVICKQVPSVKEAACSR